MQTHDLMKRAIQYDGALYFNDCLKSHKFIHWKPGINTVWLDGHFNLDELKSIIEYVECCTKDEQ